MAGNSAGRRLPSLNALRAFEAAARHLSFKDAAAEFEKATLVALWMANAYYNLGVAQDKAGIEQTGRTVLELSEALGLRSRVLKLRR